jgi:hypothetical protein
VEAACAAGFLELNIKMMHELSERRGQGEGSGVSDGEGVIEDAAAIEAHFDDIGDQIFSVLCSLCKHPAAVKGVIDSGSLDVMLDLLVSPGRSSSRLRSGIMTVITVLRSAHPAEVVMFMHGEVRIERLLQPFGDTSLSASLPLASDALSLLR